ncbi:hypothetical protein J0X14_04465 [Muricauda sp. CAU 1633]|uniref:hypothetical protein n=1 Tax=Allomuricauda sp. CAU 1633 TaxID=2816036 RepID=UPI001A90285C|nr:hypothetical protein [Muricauda sp. CAU 1633]MBO0321542.1 hypothetical protein [Muricauda sp. CAU 1633]
MKMTLQILTLFLLCVVVSCKQAGDKKKVANNKVLALNDQILGTWENVSMQIQFYTNDSIFNVPKGEWENILKIKPIKTTYLKDGSYESKYFDLNDSLLFAMKGKWKIQSDSLYLISTEGTNAYKFDVSGSLATFTGILDWDGDSLAQELYKGVQKRLE